MHLHAIPPHKVQKSPPLNVQSYSQSLSIVANIFPITSSISVMWKQQTRATSHAPPGAFPITSGYRKLEGRGK